MNAGFGLHPRRVIRQMESAIARCELDLAGLTVLTEAASGAYVVTPVMAAMAGAQKVFAYARDSRYGSAAAVAELTRGLAALAGVEHAVEIIGAKCRDAVAQADIVTNSGHLRPIDAETVSWMKPSAAVPLMYECWEFRPQDVDVEACRRRGIRFAGTNERHPSVDVFSYLGIMAAKMLLDCGVAVYGSHVLLLCDNDFGPFIKRGLEAAGAHLRCASEVSGDVLDGALDAVLVALRPGRPTAFSPAEAELLAARCNAPVIAQFWGDVDRNSLMAHDIPVWPPEPPTAGHMGILPSNLGPEPVVRLQGAGLKVGEVLSRLQQGRPVPEYWMSVLQELDRA